MMKLSHLILFVSPVRSFIALVMVMSLGAVGSASPQQPKPKSFAQWCRQKKSAPAATRHTIDVLLKEAGTKNCQRADAKLRSLTELQLISNQIVDVQPLARLSNLTSLWLNDNKIVDVQPLAGLSKLTQLLLSRNKIDNVKPLTGLPNLNELVLERNQIAVKVCPVKPESICQF